MSRRTSWISTLLGAGLVMIFVACGTDTVASKSSDSPPAPATSAPSQVVNDEPVDDHDDPTVEAHVDDVHDETGEEVHLETGTEADEHAHGMGMVDPDAPIVRVVGSEFGYAPATFSAEAGHAFTVMLHNDGALEHDITIEGFEHMGGIHLIAGEDGMNTFMLDEPGEYTFYCTVAGHREAGMTGTLVVSADDHGDEEANEEADEHADDDHEEEANEEADEHADDDHEEEAHEEANEHADDDHAHEEEAHEEADEHADEPTV